MKEKKKDKIVVDISSAITYVKMKLKDGEHPYEIGYKAMGEYWVKITDDYL